MQDGVLYLLGMGPFWCNICIMYKKRTKEKYSLPRLTLQMFIVAGIEIDETC